VSSGVQHERAQEAFMREARPAPALDLD
jgi:hypothetical protein